MSQATSNAYYAVAYSSRLRYRFSSHFHQPDMEDLIRFALAELGPDSTIIDMGTGVGYIPWILRAQVGCQGMICGVDTNSVGIATAKREVLASLEGAAREKTAFREVDVTKRAALQNLIDDGGFNGRPVDLIISSWTLHTFPDPGRVLKDWARIMDRHGRIVVDWAVAPGYRDSAQVDCFETQQYTYNSAGIETFDDSSYKGFRVASSRSWEYCADAFRKIVEQSGLCIKKLEFVRRSSTKMMDISAAVKAEALRNLRSSTEQLTPEERKKFKENEEVPLRYLEYTGSERVKAQMDQPGFRGQVAGPNITGRLTQHANVFIRADLRKE